MYNLEKKAYMYISSMPSHRAFELLLSIYADQNSKTVQDRIIVCSKAPKTQKFDEF